MLSDLFRGVTKMMESEMSKPKIGQQIRFTERGASTFFMINHRWPPKMTPECNGTLGELISIGAMNICTVRTHEGDTTNFIWRFESGLNDHFEWDGKAPYPLSLIALSITAAC